MNLILHKAVETDVDAITACVRRAYEKYVPLIGRLPNPMTRNYSRAVVEHQVWILTSHSGHLQAVLELVSESGHLLVENVAVDPEFQHQGLGHRLMDFAEQEAQRQQFPEIWLYTNEKFVANIAFYAGRGYHEFKRVPFKGTDLVFMCKPLKD